MDWIGSLYDDNTSRDHHHSDKDAHNHYSPAYTDGTVSDHSETLSPYPDDDEREWAPSLTKKLAETAVGVREVSKKLGQWSSCLVCGGASAPRRCSHRIQVAPACGRTSRACSS